LIGWRAVIVAFEYLPTYSTIRDGAWVNSQSIAMLLCTYSSTISF
jgi:hypothetical protein